MKLSAIYGVCLFTILSFSAVSCAAQYDISLEQNGSAEVSVSSSFMPQTALLMANLAGYMSSGGQQQALGLDGPALNKALQESEGVRVSNLKNAANGDISGSVSLKDIEKFLFTPSARTTAAVDASKFVSLSHSGANGSIRFYISLDSAPALLAAISPDMVDYLGALLAPASTGEKMTKAEYIELVDMMYGSEIAKEINSSVLSLSMNLPGTVRSVSGGTFSGRKAIFTIPLADILVLEKPVEISASW